MLAPLAVFLLNMLITCTVILLICWAYDTARADIEGGRSRPADSEFVLDSIPYEWRPDFGAVDDLGLGEEKWHAAYHPGDSITHPHQDGTMRIGMRRAATFLDRNSTSFKPPVLTGRRMRKRDFPSRSSRL